MYAVVETGGKQYRVEKGSTLLVDRLSADEGSKVDLRAVALLDKDLVVGEDAEKVKVEAKVAGHERGPKIRVFKYRAKKGYRRRAGHRSELTRLEVTEIKLLQRKPAASAKSSTATKSTATKKPASTPRKRSSTTKKPPAARTKSAATKTAAGSTAKKETSDGS